MSTQAQVTDWAAMLSELRRAGFTLPDLARLVGIPRTTLLYYRESGGQPKHAEGERLIAFWCNATLNDRTRVPVCPQTYSAARAE